MEFLSESQPSPPVYIPIVSLQEASQLFTKLYHLKVDKIKALPGYEVKNFYIRTLPNIDGNKSEEYVLKVFPLFCAYVKELIEVSTAAMLYLKDCGIVCSAPVKTQEGEYQTMQEFDSIQRSSGAKVPAKEENTSRCRSSFIVHTVTYIAGEVFSKSCPESVPHDWYQALGQYLAKLDKAMLSYPHTDHIPVMTKYGNECEWSLNVLPSYRARLHIIEDEQLRNLLESVITDFDKEVVPKMAQLRKGVFYGDFNDNNIIVSTIKSTTAEQTNHVNMHTPTKQQQQQFQIVGLIDFNDMSYTCLVFEVGIALTYMMYTQEKGDRLAAGGAFLKGYESLLTLTSDEWQLLPLCVAGRCAQTILAGLYSHRQDPTNDYVLLDIDKAWDVIKLIKSLPRQQIVDTWRSVSNGDA